MGDDGARVRGEIGERHSDSCMLDRHIVKTELHGTWQDSTTILSRWTFKKSSIDGVLE